MTAHDTVETVETDLPIVKRSRLSKIKDTVITAGFIGIPVAVIGASTYYSVKLMRQQLELNELTIEKIKEVQNS